MVIILGPPGSGKGTQARNIAAKTNRNYFSAGDSLKIYAENHKLLAEKIKRGELIETDDVNEYLIGKGLEMGKNVIFDGFPRTLYQANYFVSHVDLNDVECIIILNVSKEEVEKRLATRFICNNCHITYNKQTICCDLLNDKRHDDLLAETVHRRWEGFSSNIKYVKDIFEKNSIEIFVVNGENTIDNTTFHIIEIMNKITRRE
jgi:adenylate kinase